MNTAFYQSNDHLAARPGADAGGRVARTITLIALAMCLVFAKSFAASHPVAAQSGGDVHMVRIVDPDFCKNQTWPYIDQRCLKRIASDQPVAENHAGIVQVAPAPAAPLATAAISAAPASGNFAVSDSSDATGNAVHSTPSTADVHGAGQNYIQETIAPNTAATVTDNPANVRVADSHRSRRSQHWRHGAFFGFRF
jgi:hypothetical protein